MAHRGRKGGNTPRRPHFDASRRRFLTGVAGALALPGCGSSSSPTGGVVTGLPPLPDPAQSGVDHIIVVMMENRSFDHYLGWLPGADGVQAGLQYKDDAGNFHSTFPLVTPASQEWQGCDYVDPDHSHEGGALQYNGGACDGFLLGRPEGDHYAIGYYGEADLPFTAKAAKAWTVYDRYFCSIMAETYPNRFYQHAAQTPQIHNDIQQAFAQPNPYGNIPNIWDRLKEAGRTGTYYYSDLPFIGMWGSKYMDDGTAQPYSKFLSDAQAGLLPNVSFVDPVFTADADRGLSRDDHPHADIRAGQAFLDEIYNAVRNSPNWASTVLFINYDEWGGFFDHVPPPDTGVSPDEDRAACEAHGVPPVTRMGFRVPTLAISPFARRGYVEHRTYDHCSILKMIEWRWNLAPLTIRDAMASNIAESLDFANPNVADTPAFNAPTGPFGGECDAPAPASPAAIQARVKHAEDMKQLRRLAQFYGYPTY